MRRSAAAKYKTRQSAIAARSRDAGAIASAICVAFLLLSVCSRAGAAELQVFCANGLKPITANLAHQFENLSGRKVAVSFDEASILLSRLDAGDRPDVVILASGALEALAKGGKVIPGTIADLASTDALGIAVRSGAARPDTTTIDGFKSLLLGAKSIVVTDPSIGGLSSRRFFEVIEQLGIADELRPRLVLAAGAGASNALLVASGEVEVAVQLAYLLRPIAGVELVPVPRELQLTVTFAAGVLAKAAEPAEAAGLVRFLASPAAAPAIEAAGMHPG